MFKRLLLILSISSPFFCQAQNTSWVNTILSEGYDDCRDMCTDSSGNVYVTGQIEYSADFGRLSLSSAGGHDIFVAKYDSSGYLVWAKRAGGPSGDVGYGVSYDQEGNVFVVGEFEETASFSGIEVEVVGDGNNMFIAKYNSSGTIQWVRTIGTNAGSTKGYAAACDAQGNVYGLGTTHSRAILDGSRLFSTRGSSDIIFIKFDTDGDLEWCKQIGGTESDKGYGLAASDGYVYVTGTFEGSCQFSSSVTLNSNGGYDFFLAKYSESGSLQWAKKGGGSGDDNGWDVAVNKNGEIVCTGDFRSNATFSSNSISSNGNLDMFVTAYDDGGSNLWIRNGGSSGVDIGRNIATDRKSNIYVGGSFSGNADFDQLSVSSNGDEDLFLASYDSVGNIRYVKHFGGPGNDRGRGVGTDRYGNVYFSGEFWDHITFDSIYTNGDQLFDGYVIRLGNYPVCSAEVMISNPISCANSCDGELAVSVNGESPFFYDWALAPSHTTDTLSGLCAGTYEVEVIDAFGCRSNDTIILEQPVQLLISGSQITDVSCIGCSNGAIDISPDGGTAPYTFLWSDGATSEDRLNIPEGTYSVCIEDANACMVCDTFVVETHTLFSGAQLNAENQYRLFPNPASESVELESGSSYSSGGIEVLIFSPGGQLVRGIEFQETPGRFFIGDLSAGIYSIRVIEKGNNGSVSTLPLIIR
jgi:hypothetical protein